MLAPPLPVANADLGRARFLALAIPIVLIGGALFSQYVGGLHPCEMCLWQRQPHHVAIVLMIVAMGVPLSVSRVRTLVLLAALAIAVSGAIAVFHAGVEYKWWEGLTTCATSGATTLEDIMNVPLVRCDQVQWSLAGISLAGFNALFSLGGALLIVVLARRKAA